MTAEDRREDRDATLRERAENACQRDHIDGQKPQCSNCLAILAALRQTEEEARAEGERAGREAEREACAKLAEGHFVYGHSVAGPHFAAGLAAKIRARGSE